MSDNSKKIGIIVVAVIAVAFLAYMAFGSGDKPSSLGELIESIAPSASPTASPQAPRATVKATPKPATTVTLQGLPAEVLSSINSERTSTGTSLLTAHATLQAAAQAHAADMVARGYFDHTAPDGTTFAQRIAATGYPSAVVAENLGLTSSNRISDVVDGWMRSATHRENMLAPKYKSVGVGVVTGKYQGQPATYVVVVFGDK